MLLPRSFDIVMFWTLVGILLCSCSPLAGVGIDHASDMHNYEQAFDLDEDQATKSYKLTILGSNAPGHIFQPGDEPRFRFQIVNTSDRPIQTDGELEIIRYAQMGVPGNWWVPRVETLGEPTSTPVRVDLEAGGWQNLEVDVPLPQTRGGYALILDLGEHGRAYLVSCTRTFRHDMKPTLYPKQSVEGIEPAVMERMGMQSIRWGISYIPTDHPKHEAYMAERIAELKACQKHNVMVTVEIGAGHAGMPLDDGRPHLNEDDVMKGGKEDLVWLPKHDDDYQQWVYELVEKWGYPHGPINGIMLWNEPWEGHSISGWGADMLRYRNLYKRMGDAVMRAREEAGVETLIGGCDSTSNTWDKLFPEGLENSPFWPKYLDFCSMHYQGLSAQALNTAWRERDYNKGRVLLWDTESWMANTDDRYVAMVAATRAAGYDRVMGSLVRVAISDRSHGRVWRDSIRTAEGNETVNRPLESRPLAAVYSASQHFIGNRPFREILFHHGLPWVFVFDGPEDNPDDGTVVVVGDLSGVFHRVADKLLLNTVRSGKEVDAERAITEELLGLPVDQKGRRRELLDQFREDRSFEDAKLVIEAANGSFQLLDYYGNPVRSDGETIEIPLAGQSYFLRADPDRPGSFQELLEALDNARVEGIEPAEIIPYDLDRPIDRQPTLRLRMTNVLERPISGKLTVRLGDLELSYPETVTLEPRQQTWMDIKVTGGEAQADNTYPLSVVYRAGDDGTAVHHEDMHVNWIERRSITVDRDLSDWRGVLAQPILPGESGGASITEQMWLPFAEFDTDAEPGASIGYLAHDDEYFYFAAKIVDPTEHPGTVRFAERDDDDAFYPEVSYSIDREKTIGAKLASRRRRSTMPVTHPETDQPLETRWAPVAGRGEVVVDLDLPADRITQVTLLVANRWNRHVTVIDRASGKQLYSSRVEGLDQGAYLVFELSGKVRVVLTGGIGPDYGIWGIFFDPTEQSAQGPSADLIDQDRATKGSWEERYGTSGVMLPGAEPALPQGVKATVVDEVHMQEHRWPEGVRRFSYRRVPRLPSGPPWFDNVMIGFNPIPLEEDPKQLATLPGIPKRFTGYECVDYEYALNPVAEEHGGGTEIWRMQTPELPRKHFYPRQPKHPAEGAVTAGKLTIWREGDLRFVECAIPWSEIPHVKQRRDAGQPVKFSYRVNDDGGQFQDIGMGRSSIEGVGHALHPDWRGGNHVLLDFFFEE